MDNMILTILVVNLLGLGTSIADQECYSVSQGVCMSALSELWKSYQEKQLGSICKNFDELHTCTTNYATECKFSEYDKELYRTDIVNTFTREPYSCDMIGGNMEFKGDKSKATSVSHNETVYCITSVLTIIYLMMMN